jgi:hypothetical protein
MEAPMQDKKQGETRPAQQGPMEVEKGATEWIAATSVAVQALTNAYQAIKPPAPPPEKKDN